MRSLSTSTPATSLFIISLTPVSLSVYPFACFVLLMLHPLAAHAEMNNSFWSRCRSCPLHVMWGWIFEESSRHLSLSPAFSLNAAARTASTAGTLASAAEINDMGNSYRTTNACMVWFHLFPPNSPYVCLTRACTVSYRHNGGFVLRLRSDSCHRLIPPDLLMGLTTDQSVLEIKNPFVLFCLNSLSDVLSERKPSHRLDDSSVIPQKPWNISHICYATYPPSPCPPFCMNAWNTQW